MSLMAKIGALSLKTLLEQSELDEVLEKKRKAYDAAVRPARLRIARGNQRWTEIENDLVPRNRGRWLVSASTDAIYTPVRGVVFQPDSVNVIAELAPLYYYVDADDELHFFERLPGTWTEHLERLAARELRKAAPKPRHGPVES
jgi:Zn-finger nucleic acid-binding protein